MGTKRWSGGCDRRDFLKVGAGAALSLAVPLPIRSAQAQTGTVAFGVVTQNTGTYAYAGELVVRGATIALEERNFEILGRKIKLVVRDDEGKPAVGARRVSEIIASENVKFFTGNYSSTVGLAEVEVASKEKVLQYAAGGAEDFTGARCSRYTFMWSAHAYTAMRTVLDYVAKELPNAKKFYTITADYAFGHAILKYTRVVAQEKGFQLLGNDNHPLGERQFTQYLTKAIAAKPDILLLLTGGADAETAIRQFHTFGVKATRVVAPWAIEVDEMKELTPEMRNGLILGENYYHEINTPVNKAFVERYLKKHNFPPAYAAASGYDTFRTILIAMERAKSVEVPDVIRTMEGMRWDGLLGETTIDAATHQTLRPYFVVKGKAPEQMKSPTDYAEIVSTGSTPQPKQHNECKGLGPF
jgi:branched-chain amino acid transport system substrate-binding protein